MAGRLRDLRGALLWIGVALAAAAVLLAAKVNPESVWPSFVYLSVVWALAFALTLWSFVAASLTDFSKLARAAAGASSAALWLVPALLLVAVPEPLLIAAGLLLAANAARLLASSRTPISQFDEQDAAASAKAKRPRSWHPFASAIREERRGEARLARAGALAVQVGVVAAFIGHPLAAVVLVGAGAAAWSIASIERGAAPVSGDRNPAHHAVLSVLLTMLVAFAMATTGFSAAAGDSERHHGEGESLGATTRRLLGRLAHSPHVTKTDGERATARPATQIVGPPRELGTASATGIPGVILRPQPEAVKPQHGLVGPASARYSFALPLVIPFTGEYRLFRASSLSLPPFPSIFIGTPYISAFVTTNGEQMETEAYQALTPMIDFSCCQAIKVEMISGEVLPASATMQLVAGERINVLGRETFGLNMARRETLQFSVPAQTAGLVARAIRVLFRRNPIEDKRSAKIAVERFTLVPRR